MKIIILGATGRVGKEIMRRATEDGHQVTAFLRNPDKLSPHSLVTVQQGNARSKNDLLKAIPGHEAVISALSTDGTTTLSESMPLIIEAMQHTGIRRIITIGTAGILNSRQEPHKYRYETSESKRTMTRAAEEHRKAYETLKATDLAWTVVCPTYLPDGEPEGRYRVSSDVLPLHGQRISVCDAADFAYSQLTDDSYIQKRVGIAY